MKINQIQQNSAVSRLDGKMDGATDATAKTINLLMAGDKFDATIIDIQRSRLKLLLASGEKLTAHAEVLPEARIGELTSFIVREHQNGKILLEMLKSGESKLANVLAREALMAADMPVTDENIKLVKEMIAAKLPIDASSLQKSAFFYYSGGEKRTALDRVLFLVSEGFPENEKSLKTLDVLERGLKLGKEIERLGKELAAIEPEALRTGMRDEIQRLTQASRIELSPENTESVRTKDNKTGNVRAEYIKTENIKTQDIKTELEKLYEEADNAVKLIVKRLSTEADNPAVQKVLERAERLSDSIDFIGNISRYRQYLQIPFTVNGRNGDGELYIFKDGKGRSLKNDEPVSALIALDYAALGRVEVFAVKTDKNINLTFRAAADGVLKLVNQNAGRLKELLSDKGLYVTALQLKRLDEPFKLTGTPIVEAEVSDSRKRYSFDMRV